MARINTYAIDNNVTSQDKWIGTDVAGNVTKNFTPENVANWINKTNAVGIAGQSNFKFQVDLSPERLSGTISFELGSGDGTAFSAINNIIISKYGGDGNLILNYLENLVGTYILLCQVDDTNNFGVYQLGSLTQLENEPNFYNAVLSVQSSNGTLTANEYYGVVAYPASSIVSVTGLEAIDEGNGNGWRLIGRDPDNYGNIGAGAIDFSNSTEATNENGSVGDGAITFGSNNINESGQSIVTGSGVNLRKTNEFGASNIVTGESPLNIWGVTYNSLIAAWRSEVNVEGTSYDTNVVYQSLIVGDGINFYSGRDSGAVGGGLISGSTGCFTVGVGNEDLTTTTSTYITNYYNNYGPRFIVGCGTYQPGGSVTSRQNGFVVMSDGTATFPIGNVGIGTSSPSAKLDIIGANSNSEAIELYGDSSYGATIGYSRGGSYNWRAGVGGSGSTSGIPYSSWGIEDSTVGSPRLVIAHTSGNVGIGTTSPSQLLDVSGNIKGQKLLLNTTNTGYTLYSNGESRINGVILQSVSNTDYISKSSGAGDFYVRNGVSGERIYLGATNNSGQFANYLSFDGANDNFTLRTANSDRLHINSSGDVGIGTTSPTSKLHVVGGTYSTGGFYTPNSATGYFTNLSSSAGMLLSSLDAVELVSGGNSTMFLRPSGNVGIGTTSPRAKLEIKGTGGNDSGLILANSNDIVRHYFSSDVAGSVYAITYDGSGGNDFQIQSDGDIVLAGSTGGNVGIGTDSPSEKLDVDGNVKLGATTGRQLMFGENKYGAVRLGNNLVVGGNSAVDIRTGNAALSSQSSRVFINQVGFVGVGTTTPIALLDVNGPIKMGNATTTPLSTTVGTMRYRADSNNSYVEMIMQTGAGIADYEWVVIKQNTW